MVKPTATAVSPSVVPVRQRTISLCSPAASVWRRASSRGSTTSRTGGVGPGSARASTVTKAITASKLSQTACQTVTDVTFDPKMRSEEHTSELQSQSNLVCRLLLEKKKNTQV